MDTRIQLIAILGSSALLLVILDLVRRRRLLERYALLWLLSGIVLLCLSIWRDLLGEMAARMGIAYPPNALFLIAFGFTTLLLLHFTLAVSRLADQSKMMAQRLALLEERQQTAELASMPREPKRTGPVPVGDRAGDADVLEGATRR
jgi:hypothetical protein